MEVVVVEPSEKVRFILWVGDECDDWEGEMEDNFLLNWTWEDGMKEVSMSRRALRWAYVFFCVNISLVSWLHQRPRSQTGRTGRTLFRSKLG